MIAIQLLKEMKAAKTHCKHGHLWTPATTYTAADGKRFCKICRSQHKKAYYQRKKEVA